MYQPDWKPTHTQRDSYWHGAVTIWAMKMGYWVLIKKYCIWCKNPHVHDDNGPLTMSLVASFSGVWGGSVAAGLLDGMAESSSVKPSTESGETEQVKTWERPSNAPGATSSAVCDAVGHSVLAGSVQPPFLCKRRNTQQDWWEFTPRADAVWGTCLSLTQQGGKLLQTTWASINVRCYLQHYLQNQLWFSLEWPKKK